MPVFLSKKSEAFAVASLIFSTKNFSVFGYKVAKHVRSSTKNFSVFGYKVAKQGKTRQNT